MKGLRMSRKKYTRHDAQMNQQERVAGRAPTDHHFLRDSGGSYCYWCRRRDLNPHGLRHTPLKRACLPFHHFGIRKHGNRTREGHYRSSPKSLSIKQVSGRIAPHLPY